MRTYGLKHLVFALIVGMAGGAAFGLHAHRWGARWMLKHDMTPRLVEKFSRELALSPDQRQKLTAILEGSRTAMIQLHNDMRPRFEGLRTKTGTAIEKILSPDQVVKFRAMRAKWLARHPDPEFGAR